MKWTLPWGSKEAKKTPVAGQVNKNNYKNFLVKAVGFISSQGANRGVFTSPEFNFLEIKTASENDSYIKMSLIRYSDLMFKAGYELKGENDKAIEYLKTRLRIMSFSTNKPVDILFQEVADDLVKYSNAFLVKARVPKIMSGIKAKGVFNDNPIGGYFKIDPTTVKVQRDKNGNIIKYQQVAGTETKDFPATEVIHLYLDKDSSNAFGTPRLWTALEDVKLLRKIEGNVVNLIYRFAMPIYQWMIGLPTQGFQASDTEIREAQHEIENMPLDGVIVTNEKTTIKAIGAEGTALDASQYLAYFEKRVFTALGMSEAMMGRGGAKQDADSMEAQIHDSVKKIQHVMSIFLNNYLLNELLLEGGFNPILNEEDMVSFIFNEISLDTKIKLENHEMLKYQSNLNTFDEARHAMGKRKDVDEEQLYMNKIENKAAIDQIRAKTDGSIEVAKVNGEQAAKKQAAAGNGKSKNTKPNKDASTRNRPTNQHGTTSVKIKESFDSEEAVKKDKESHKFSYPLIYKKYKMLCNDIIDTDSDIDMLLSITKENMLKTINSYIELESSAGQQRAISEVINKREGFMSIPNPNITLKLFEIEANETITGLLKDLKKRLNGKRDRETVLITFNSLEYRIRFLLEFILPKAYWYSYIKMGAAYGIKEAKVIFKGSDDKHDHDPIIKTDLFSLEDIPAYHSFCDCEVKLKVGDN